MWETDQHGKPALHVARFFIIISWPPRLMCTNLTFMFTRYIRSSISLHTIPMSRCVGWLSSPSSFSRSHSLLEVRDDNTHCFHYVTTPTDASNFVPHYVLVYGTNFQDFPELSHNIGYFWMICGIVFAVFVSYSCFASFFSPLRQAGAWREWANSVFMYI